MRERSGGLRRWERERSVGIGSREPKRGNQKISHMPDWSEGVWGKCKSFKKNYSTPPRPPLVYIQPTNTTTAHNNNIYFILDMIFNHIFLYVYSLFDIK